VLACPEAYRRCGDACVDVRSNGSHCGACGHTCAEHLVCEGGDCVCEQDGLVDCGAGCIDLSGADEHCGRCDNPCPLDQACVEGECTCELEGYGVCAGRCIDLRSDPDNCGDCDVVCDPGDECMSGHCGGVLITETNDAYGNHGSCDSFNECGDAETCALWACQFRGFDGLTSYGREAPCNSGEFRICHLFRGPGNLDEDWGTSCGVMGVGDILCH